MVRWRNAHTPCSTLAAAGRYLTITFLNVICPVGRRPRRAIPADLVVHKIAPVVVVIDWLIEPPTSWILFQRARWLAYPMVWVSSR
jgi:hypothetical protein